ncbi:reducing polyketide synthase [Niveomyces insectorum RCEF 264]|uniref:Reducing polyketide synthase n=1 Tax=Niveomyces insectorum RCEF 264 TaxID=1081102 RepID=A0A167TES2_9HYPO|nr:reducing polyketide synthase [Niveomyces insectorum RCEF 264]
MPSTSNPAHVPVAIVGLACRFPGEATSPSKFWDLLKNGRDAYSPTTDRYNADAFYHPQARNRQNVLATKGGHFLKQDPYAFDAAFFNITAAEAMALDPKQRIAMEVVYEALENAGKPLQNVAGTQTACYIGSSMSDYRDAVVRDFGHSPKYHILGTCEEMISNRVSHFLDIHGPSATIHTACSSSLVATHLGCQSLQSGESEMALVGGVGMIISPDGNMQLNNLGFLSPEGHSRSFDERADGYGRGEGCGILVLKRLDRALADGDTIRAGVTMPSRDAQAALIKYVYEAHNLEYRDTQYVEAHGTGTKAGDPAEVGALHRTIGQHATKARKLWVGSVKPNIGHLEAAAGVAGIIKGVLAMENGLIPPNIHFAKRNPAILDDWNIDIPTRLTPWPAAKSGRRMSVSGFGMGGTNGHVVLEAFTPWHTKLVDGGLANGPLANGATNGPANGSLRDFTAPRTTSHGGKRLFVFSSQDQAGFQRVGHALLEHLESLGPAVAASRDYAANLAHTLSVARSGLSWRACLLAENSVELQEKLSTELGGNATRTASSQPRIGFVFTGQGAQWARMGVELLDRPVFRTSITKSEAFLRELGCDWDPAAELRKDKDDARLGTPALSQPMCTVLQIALVDELCAWGVTPSRVVGHSSGEIAAAYSTGALSHRDAVAVAYFRGKVSAGLTHLQGGMMAVGCSAAEAKQLIAQTNLTGGGSSMVVSVACVNAPQSVTLSGDVAALDELRAVLDERGVFARRLQVDVAYHSAHMNAAVGEYAAALANLESAQPVVQGGRRQPEPIMVSSVTGGEVDGDLAGPYYWVRNLVSPVLFADAVKDVVAPADGDGTNAVDLLIEIGPHGALGGPIEQILTHHGIKNVGYHSMLTRGQNSLDQSLALAGQLFLQGLSLNVQNVNGDAHCRLLTDLPPYPWNHSKTFRADSRMHRELINQKHSTRSLIGAPLPTLAEHQHAWRSFIRLSEEPWLRGHTVGSTVLFPGAGIVSIVLEATQQLVDPGKTARAFRLRDVNLFAAMALTEDQATEVVVHLRPHLLATAGTTTTTPAGWWEFTVSSCVGTDQLRDNARGLVTIDYCESRSPQMAQEETLLDAARIADYHRIRAECPGTYAKEQFYQHMTKASWSYGALFQGVEDCHPGDGQTTFGIRLVDVGETFSRGQLARPFLVNAASLDAVFQSWLGATYKDGAFAFDKPFVPTSMGALEIAAGIPADAGYVLPGLCRAERYGFNELSADIAIFDKDLSTVVLSVHDFRTSELDMEAGKPEREGADVDPADITSEVRWDCALSLLQPEDVDHVVRAVASAERMNELLRLALHEYPAATVTEVILDAGDRANAVMARLPESVISPSRVRYAVVSAGDSNKQVLETLGTVQLLGEHGAPLPAAAALADLVVVSLGHRDADLVDRLVGLAMERLATPEARFIVASGDEATTARLAARGFEIFPNAEEGTALALHTARGAESLMSAGQRQKPEVVILHPSSTTSATKAFSSALHEALKDQDCAVRAKSWSDDLGITDVKGRVFVSLLELEAPMLDRLSARDFEHLRTVVLNCERLLWVTAGDNPALGMVDGFARCIRSEIAGATFQILHLSAATAGLQRGAALATQVLFSDGSDNEFREVDGRLQVARIHKSHEQNASVRAHLEDSTRLATLADQADGLRLIIGKPGLLDTLKFVTDERLLSPLPDDEVEIQVKATGLNFRDVMACMGIIPVPWLGQEASGVVTRTGGAVTGWKPGDRVSTIHVGTHATRIRVNHRGLARMPDAMSFEEAAAVPVVHMTAYYAFVTVAKLRRGQSVLIHAAAGGVGQAAIQLAKHMGLVVYATVGTEDKRSLLVEQYGIPDEHIFHSRDASFVKGISRVTDGRGVDCVLNSLSGELLRASFGCLATFGTFIEIGLRDITNNMRLDMRPFGKSTSFAFINNHTLYEEDRAAFYRVFHEAFQLVNEGVLRAPSPVTTYPIGQVDDAFRAMQQGKHRGKIVLSFRDDDAQAPVLFRARSSLKLNPDATYLFVGGLGGLGRSLAKEFVASGARHIAFLSRSGDSTPAARAVVDALAAAGAQVQVYRGDVADEASLVAAMARCAQDLPPVKGVIQMAMVLRDVVFEKMTYDEWTAPVGPKVQGSWNLHRYFGHERPLDFMVLCSSSSGVYGYPSQAQYAAGNTYQDALSHYRRARGLPSVSVNLGIMRDVGVLAETGTRGNIKLWEDVLGIREPAFHALMKSLINQQLRGSGDGPVQVCTGLGTADIMAAHGLARPEYFDDPRFGPLAVNTTVVTNDTATAAAGAGDGQKNPMASLASRLGRATSKDQATEIITDALVQKTAKILQMPPSEVDPGRPLYRYGVDSLVALEVRNWISREMKANMALLEILAAVPIESFAGKIAEKSKLVTVS